MASPRRGRLTRAGQRGPSSESQGDQLSQSIGKQVGNGHILHYAQTTRKRHLHVHLHCSPDSYTLSYLRFVHLHVHLQPQSAISRIKET